ncbi:MAG: Gldg family protein [Planctomycetota bacterium]
MSVGYGSGRGTRLATGLRVLLGGILALAVVLLVNYLAARPGMRVRIDMTAKDVNTLDPATVRTLENLQGPITADVFFEPVRQPLTELVGQVQARTVALLDRMALAAPDRFRVRHNDLHDKMATQARMEQLRLRGLDNVVVLSQDGEAPGEVLGKPKAVRLLGGLATIDLGNPNPDQYRPPLLQSFDAEANLLRSDQVGFRQRPAEPDLRAGPRRERSLRGRGPNRSPCCARLCRRTVSTWPPGIPRRNRSCPRIRPCSR